MHCFNIDSYVPNGYWSVLTYRGYRTGQIDYVISVLVINYEISISYAYIEYTKSYMHVTTYVQGPSWQSVYFKLILTDRNMQVRYFWRYLYIPEIREFEFHQTSLQKSNIFWPQQPPTERKQIVVKNWIFDDSIHFLGTSIGHFGARDDQILRIRRIFEEIGL